MERIDVRLNPLAYFADSRVFRALMARASGRFSWWKSALVLFMPSVLCVAAVGYDGDYTTWLDFPLLREDNHGFLADVVLYPLGGWLTLLVLSNTRRVPGDLSEQVDWGALQADSPEGQRVAGLAARGFVRSRTYRWLRAAVLVVGGALWVGSIYQTSHCGVEPLFFGDMPPCRRVATIDNLYGFLAFGFMKLFQWVVVGPLVVEGILVFILSLNRLIAALRRAQAFRLQVLHADRSGGLARLGRVAVRLNLCVSLGAVLLVVKISKAGWDTPRVAATLLVVFLLLVVFFGTLYEPGKAMRAERQRLRAPLVARCAQLGEQIQAVLTGDAELRPDARQRLAVLYEEFDRLDSLRARIARLPMWPWDLWTRGGVVAATLAPVFPAVAKRIFPALWKQWKESGEKDEEAQAELGLRTVGELMHEQLAVAQADWLDAMQALSAMV